MNRKRFLLFLLVLLAAGCGVGVRLLQQTAALQRLNDGSVRDMQIRSVPLTQKDIDAMRRSDAPGEVCALRTLEHVYGENRWEKSPQWEEFSGYFRALFSDMERLPLDGASCAYSFEDSWNESRTYGGDRTHEGCDPMPPEQKRDTYKVYSVSDGVITAIGWLPQGGWRIGVTAPGGTYFYYAHLSSYAGIKKGDRVAAGDFLGYMGDTGYSEVPGTTGNFPVHLHFGVYFIVDGEEVSVNPYGILRYYEAAEGEEA